MKIITFDDIVEGKDYRFCKYSADVEHNTEGPSHFIVTSFVDNKTMVRLIRKGFVDASHFHYNIPEFCRDFVEIPGKEYVSLMRLFCIFSLLEVGTSLETDTHLFQTLYELEI